MNKYIKISNLSGKDVKDLISVRYVITTDKNRPSLHDVLFYVRNNRLYSEAMEGRRFSISSIACNCIDGVFFNILATDLVTLNKSLKVKSNVNIIIDKNKGVITFEVDDTIVDCKLVNTPSFISLSNLISDIQRFKLVVSRDALLKSLKELSKISVPKKETKVCILNIKDNVLTLKLRGVDDVLKQIDCSYSSTLDIAFNIKHLTDMINSIKDKELVLEFKSENDPIVYKGEVKKDMLHPIKFK